jgi:hypothetical protein
MNGLYPIIRRIRRPLVAVDVEPPKAEAQKLPQVPAPGPAPAAESVAVPGELNLAPANKQNDPHPLHREESHPENRPATGE